MELITTKFKNYSVGFPSMDALGRPRIYLSTTAPSASVRCEALKLVSFKAVLFGEKSLVFLDIQMFKVKMIKIKLGIN